MMHANITEHSNQGHYISHLKQFQYFMVRILKICLVKFLKCKIHHRTYFCIQI